MKPARLLALVFCACVSCRPSRPLNERSTELAWEAWLLVDQSNRQSELGVLRRRITPKSVFVVPTFSPDALPPCADGYKSDAMGRCAKIIKINESAHFDFLLQRLNAQFPDYEEAEEGAATQGPLQLNIPLGVLVDAENETEVAIVVAPSHQHRHRLKVDVKRHGGGKFDVEGVAAILRVKPEDVEMTTIADLTTTMAMTAMAETTTLETTTDGGTEPPTTTTTDAAAETTTIEGEALFFQLRV